jgi:epoxyqueuosine reductase
VDPAFPDPPAPNQERYHQDYWHVICYTMTMNAYELSAAIKAHAHHLGFSDCRIVPLGEAPHATFFENWLAAGRAGEMKYLERNVAKRRSPALLAEEGHGPFDSMIVLGVDYHQYDLPAEVRDDPSRGIIAAYAWGDDYHELIRPLLYELDAYVRSLTGRKGLGKGMVDTGPVLERDWAEAAGLGFTGKNCCTIVPGAGSWHFLATLLVPEALAPDQGNDGIRDDTSPSRQATSVALTLSPTCGRCTRCLRACPTNAFVGAYDLDPQRCISYWTIEAAGDIPRELRPLFGNRIFGCDICQEVCPYNRRRGERAPLLAGLHAQAHRVAPPLLEGFAPAAPYWLDDRAFSDHFVRSPIKRAKRHGMLRNVCVALGNWGSSATVPALQEALSDPHPGPRRHAAWALGQVFVRHPHSAIAERAAGVLAARLGHEADEGVRLEIATALTQPHAVVETLSLKLPRLGSVLVDSEHSASRE